MPPRLLRNQLGFGLVAGCAVGVLDAALVTFRLAGAGGAYEYVPLRIWAISPLVWMAVAAAIAGPVLIATTRSMGLTVATTVAGLFLAIRLRTHPGLLVVALSGLLAAAALMRGDIRRRLDAGGSHWASGALVAMLACCAAASIPWSESKHAREPPGNIAPNVIVIFVDTVRYDAVFDVDGEVRSGLKTMARLRAESTVYTRAFAPSPWTLPSHLAAVTGLPAEELGISFDAQSYTRSEPTLAERYRERGYRTAAVLSNSFLNRGSGFARGVDAFEQAEAGLDLCRTGPGLMAEQRWPWFAASICNWSARHVTTRALRLMRDDERPFFLMLNYMDAHDPYFVASDCGGSPGYDAAIRCLDHHLAPIVDWRSSRRPTVLALVSDHGEQFGEHGLRRHGNSLYLQLLHVPLMIRGASRAGAVAVDPVSIALLPALLDGRPAGPPRSDIIRSVLHPPAAEGRASEWSALDGAWHLIVRQGGSESLYDLVNDPREEVDLSEDPPRDAAITRLRTEIGEMRRKPRPDTRGFRSLGYIQ